MSEESHKRLNVDTGLTRTNGALAALLKLAVCLLQDHHFKDGYNKKWCPVCTDVVTGYSNLARLEAALQQPAEATKYSAYCHFFHQTGICGIVDKKHDDLEIGHGFIKCPVTAAPATEPVCSFAHNQLMGIFGCDFDEGRDDCNVHPGERVQAATEPVCGHCGEPDKHHPNRSCKQFQPTSEPAS